VFSPNLSPRLINRAAEAFEPGKWKTLRRRRCFNRAMKHSAKHKIKTRGDIQQARGILRKTALIGNGSFYFAEFLLRLGRSNRRPQFDDATDDEVAERHELTSVGEASTRTANV